VKGFLAAGNDSHRHPSTPASQNSRVLRGRLPSAGRPHLMWFSAATSPRYGGPDIGSDRSHTQHRGHPTPVDRDDAHPATLNGRLDAASVTTGARTRSAL